MPDKIERKQACPEQRRRGGQPGNQNARKHGYYSRIFNRAERADYYSAGDVQGIDEEIALMRHIIKTLAQSKDDKNIMVLVRSANVLNKLVRTRHKVQSSRYDGLKDAVANVVRDVLIPMGVCIGDAVPKKPFPDETKTDNGQNEPALP